MYIYCFRKKTSNGTQDSQRIRKEDLSNMCEERFRPLEIVGHSNLSILKYVSISMMRRTVNDILRLITARCSCETGSNLI